MAKFFGFLKFLFKKRVPQGTVTFEVSGGPGSFNVTYKADEKKTMQNPEVRSGWQYSFIGHPGDYYYFSAQANRRNAVVNVKGFKGGKIFKEDNKTGDYVVATISGEIPEKII